MWSVPCKRENGRKLFNPKNAMSMKLSVLITETSYGSVSVDVPEGATEKQIHDAAYSAYCDGKACFDNADFEVHYWEEE